MVSPSGPLAYVEARLAYEIDVVAAAQAQADGTAVIVDTRRQASWDQGHIAGALHLPHDVGFGTNFEETESGVVGLGVAIHDPAGQPVAAITTAIPASRFKRPAMPGIVEALRRTAAGIKARLAEGGAGG